MIKIYPFRLALLLGGTTLAAWISPSFNTQDIDSHKKVIAEIAAGPASNVENFFELGKKAHEQKDFTEAIKAYRAALDIDAKALPVYDKLGIALEQTGQSDAALKAYFKAMSLHPHFNQTRFAETKSLPEHKLPDADFLKHKTPWRGESLIDKTIYIYAENGLGDTINFCRFLPELKKLGAKVFFKPQGPLVSLFQDNPLESTVINNIKELESTHIDYHCSLLSLPHYLGTDAQSIPGKYHYLEANHKKVAEFKEKFFDNNDLKIGIFWQGDPKLLNDHNRSTKLTNFYPITQIPGVKVYSLQKFFGVELLKSLPDDVAITDLDPYVKDFTDTAAVMKNLDLVISVDSAVAHMSGSLGTEIWMLTPYETDWRWLGYSAHATDVWYSKLTKFRQNASCSWEPVFKELAEKLQQKVATKKHS